MDDSKSGFLGRGWRFPPLFDRSAPTALTVAGAEDVEQSLRLIMMTAPSQRPLLANFGTETHTYLFRDLDATTTAHMCDAIRAAIVNSEPRVRVDDVQVSSRDYLEGYIMLSVSYTIRATNSRHNVVHPYSLTELNV